MPSESCFSSNISDSYVEGLLFHTVIVKDILDFSIFTCLPLHHPKLIYWTVDGQATYSSFNHDFGPPNLAHLYRFCQTLGNRSKVRIHHIVSCFYILTQKAVKEGKKLVFYSNAYNDVFKLTNALFLIGTYAIIINNSSVNKVNKWLEPLFCTLPGLLSIGAEIASKYLTSYCDASASPHPFQLNLSDCWSAIHKAIHLKLINFDTFNLSAYELYDQVCHGDWNWIVPNKLLAFASPVDVSWESSDSEINVNIRSTRLIHHPPRFYISKFKELGIKAVIRTCKPEYDCNEFKEQGLEHYDLYFVDCSVPSLEIVQNFLDIVHSVDGAVAVHCKAGLGRTGTLIACYLIGNYGFTALQAIAHCRLHRPGSVVGDQQNFLLEYVSYLG